MASLIVKKYQSKRVRVIECKKKGILFVGNDVAKILGYKRLAKAITDNVDKDDRWRLTWRASPHKVQAVLWDNNDYMPKWLIDEAGLYALIINSKMPFAKKFKHWVTHEVLPSIRKYGSYSVKKINPSYLISDPIKRAEQWIKEQKRMLRFADSAKRNRELADTATKVNRKLKKIHDTFAGAQNNISISKFAKILCNSGIQTGQKRLFKWLRNHHYLMTGNRRKQNIPYQKFVDQGLFAVSEYTLHDANKINVIKVQITPKGQQYFVKKFLKESDQHE